MPAYVIFDVEIRDAAKYQEFMSGVKPALEAAGACSRGGAGLMALGSRAALCRSSSPEAQCQIIRD